MPVVMANFINPEAMHHPAGYTHVVEVTAGRPVYIAGQVALDPPGRWSGRATSVPRPGRCSTTSGGTAGRRGRLRVGGQLTCYLVDATQLPVVREVRDQYVNIQQPPASTAVEVQRLVRDDLLIGVEAVAVVASFQPMTATA